MAEHRVIDRTESFLQSAFSDIVTFSFLSFCVWLSQGSRWWTLVTGIMFLVFALGKVAVVFGQHVKVFRKKSDLIAWAESLDWGDK